MADKLKANETLGSSSTLNEITSSKNLDGTKAGLDVAILQTGLSINPAAKFVEATYSVGDTVVTYNWYESSSKVTLYNTITLTFTEAQDTTFTSAEWS